MTLFFNMIDIAALAGFIVWESKNAEWNNGKRHRRRLFLLQLGLDLVSDHLNRRRQQPQSMPRNVRLALQAIAMLLVVQIITK